MQCLEILHERTQDFVMPTIVSVWRVCALVLIASFSYTQPADADRSVNPLRPGVPPEGIAASAVYWIHGIPVNRFGEFRRNDAIIIDGTQVSTLSGCEPVEATIEPVGDGQGDVLDDGTGQTSDLTGDGIFRGERLFHITAEWADCGPDTESVALEGTWSLANGVFQGHLIYSLVPHDVPVVATTTSEGALRVGTYNVQFLPSIAFTKDPEIARRIAERIKASRYDIIVLNEVFDEDIRSGESYSFVENLKDTYPHRVEYLSGDAAFDPLVPDPNEDSGLMLFSRFPFEPLPTSTFAIKPLHTACKGTDCDRVAFVEFQDCSDDDCFSEKGAGYVRIRNPLSNQIYNVVFTHLQASYLDDSLDDWFEVRNVRRHQMDDIQSLIEGTMTPLQIQSEEIFVLGDLNIDGDSADPDLGSGQPDTQNLYEWAFYFDTPGIFFTDRIRDGWAYDTSPDDRGLTNLVAWGPGTDNGSRLDYFLHGSGTNPTATAAVNPLCVEHLSLSHSLRDGSPTTESNLGEPGTEAGPNQLSDHIGITADLGPSAPYCSAATPYVVPLPIGGNGVKGIAGNISHLGGMQWFRFDDPGTYSFAVPGNFEFHVYEATDLSTPITPYKDKVSIITTGGIAGPPVDLVADKFRIPTAPFYVRVFDAQRSAKGNFTLWAREHHCSGIDDTCFLGPAEPMDYAFVSNVPLGADDTAWFELETEAADSAAVQQLGFHVEGLTGSGVVTLEVHQPDPPGTMKVGEDTIADADPGNPGTWRLDAARPEAASTTYYLLVKRLDVADSASFQVSWTTDLTVFHGAVAQVSGAVPLMLVNFEQEDSNGNDTLYFSLSVDGTEVIHQQDIGDADTGWQGSLEGWIGTRRFLDEIVLTLYEQDASKDGGPPAGDDDVTDDQVMPLARTTIGATNRHMTFKWDPPPGSASSFSGHYELQYNLRHGLDQK